MNVARWRKRADPRGLLADRGSEIRTSMDRVVTSDDRKHEIMLDLLVTILALMAAYYVGSIFLPMLTGGAGYSPTPRRKAREALEMVGLRRDDVLYDLGCGTGVVLAEASRYCDNVKGIEIEPLRWLVAKMRARDAEVILGDLFRQDISDADVIFLFQYEVRVNERIARKIKEEARSGTRVVSYLHPIEGLQPYVRRGDISIYTT